MNLKETYFVLHDHNGNYCTREFSNNGPRSPFIKYAEVFDSPLTAKEYMDRKDIKDLRLCKLTLTIEY